MSASNQALLTDVDRVLVLAEHPHFAKCILPHLEHLHLNRDKIEGGDSRLLKVMGMLRQGEKRRARAFAIVEHYEGQFREARSILGLASIMEFYSAFEFDELESQNQSAAAHDTIAEILFVHDLRDHGFIEIQKLRKQRKRKTADFIARHSSVKYAIDLKVVRGSGPQSASAVIPAGEFERVLFDEERATYCRDLIRKVTDKDFRVVQQVLKTKAQFNCDRTMIALDTRRMGRFALLERAFTADEVRAIAAEVLIQWPEIDHIAYKWMAECPQPILFEPQLPA